MPDTQIAALDEMKPRRGADVVLEVLRSEDVQYVFGNPGTTEMPLMDTLSEVSDISYVLGLQEASVVGMADGYAKASGRPGFINLHTSGGLGNAMGAIIGAQVSNTPLVITAGQQDSRHAFTDPLLSGDLVGIAGPVMKSAHEVVAPDHLPTLLRRAFHESCAAPSGPVFLSLPMNVMESETTVSPGEMSRIDRVAIAGSLDELGDRLALVRLGRLAIIAGDEIFTSGAAPEVVALAEALGAPVFGSSWPGHIPFPTSHPLWSGSLPSNAQDIRARLAEFETVFAIGGHSLIIYLYSDGQVMPPGCQLFQLSANLRDLGRTYPTALSCAGDIKASLQVLLPSLRRKLARHHIRVTGSRDGAGATFAHNRADLQRRARIDPDEVVTTPLTAAAEVVRAIGPQIAIVDEAPATMSYVRALLASSSSRQYFGNRSGILGWGMPAAVGISLGLGREPVVSLVGDGSSLYSPQALWTAARERLPITFIVINNREYNILKAYMRGQPHYLGARANRFIGMDIVDPPIDFLALAAAMGLPAQRVSRAADVAGAVEDGIASRQANLIEIPVSISP